MSERFAGLASKAATLAGNGITFLMVFLIQNTQNRDSTALHLKIDELIRAIEQADDTMIEAEDDTEKELK